MPTTITLPELLIFVGVIMLILGAFEIISGETTFNIAGKYRPPVYVTYYGTGPGWVKVIVGAVYLGAGFILPKLTDARKDLGGIILIGGIVVIGASTILFQLLAGNTKPTSTVPKTLSVHQAAKYLKLSDQQVIGLVESGKLEAHKIDNQYEFDKEILAVYAGK